MSMSGTLSSIFPCQIVNNNNNSNNNNINNGINNINIYYNNDNLISTNCLLNCNNGDVASSSCERFKFIFE